MNIDLLLCILGMALVTLIPRVMPVTLLAGRELPPLLTRWLSFVPVAVMAALLGAEEFGFGTARGRQAQHLRG